MIDKKNWFISPLFTVLVVFLLGTAGLSAQQTGLQTVDADTFFEALEMSATRSEGVILDVRTEDEYKRGHAPGSVNIDYYSPSFPEQLDTLDKSETYFIYCNSGNRSGRTLPLMQNLGFTSVYDLAGGWSRNSRRLQDIPENREGS